MIRSLSNSVLLAVLVVASPAVAQDADTAKSNDDSKAAAEKPAIKAVGQIDSKEFDNKMSGALGMRRNVWRKVVVKKPNDLLRLRTTNPSAAARTAFRRRIDSHEDEFVDCVKDELAGRSEDGFVSLEVIAEADGSVSKSTVVKNELGDKIEACVGELLAPINYGEASGQEKFVVFVQWKPNFKPPKNAFAMSGSGGMGMRGTGRTNNGFGRIVGLGKVSKGETKSEVKTKTQRSRGNVVPSQWSVEGGLEESSVRRVIRRKRNALRYCYERELQTTPKLAGQITFTVEIQESGRVDRVSTSDSSLDNQKVEDCMKRVHKRLRFPKPESGSAKLSYQLDLSVK